eukprot:1513506-Pyramimonas_sp.AAC.1
MTGPMAVDYDSVGPCARMEKHCAWTSMRRNCALTIVDAHFLLCPTCCGVVKESGQRVSWTDRPLAPRTALQKVTTFGQSCRPTRQLQAIPEAVPRDQAAYGIPDEDT